MARLSRRRMLAALGGVASAGAAGCAVRALPPYIELWHTRRQHQQQVLDRMIAAFNALEPGVAIRGDSYNSYDDLNRKIIVTAQTGAWPGMATVYENQVPDYMAAGIVRPLDDLVSHPQWGLSAQELADFMEIFLRSNRFPTYGNQLLSFPFTKSVLVMYANRSLLGEAGVTSLPVTWEEFIAACGAVRAVTRRPAYALELDPSTLHGFIFSLGGEVANVTTRETLYDSAAGIAMFALLRQLVAEGLASQMSGAAATSAFQTGQVAFAIASSSARAQLERRIADSFDWSIGLPPRRPDVAPVTVLYGPNVCLFRSTPEREVRAWRFVRYFTSTDVTAEWAIETGYLPVRQSAAKTPRLQRFYATNPRARAIFAALAVAKPEPPLARMQLVRNQLREAATAVVTGILSPQAAARDLKRRADAVLQERF